MGGKKKKAAVVAVALVCIMLLTELPRIINAQGELYTSEQEEVLSTEENSDAQTDENGSQEEKSKEESEDKQPDNIVEPSEDNQVSASLEEKKEEAEAGVTETEKVTSQDTKTPLAQTRSNELITAQDITPVDENDPMYWMGQRKGGDTNRAMVWFGEYWQDSNASIKSPVLWRTLRSDGKGNYGGAVTLLSEFVLNSVYFDQNSSKNQHWYNTSLGKSSDLRAWMNGVGTGAMDPDFDLPSRFTGNNITYNNDGGGQGDIRGSFYANTFDDNEKELIIPTKLAGAKGQSTTGGTVTDKIFALSGCYGYPNTIDAKNTLYFSNNNDRIAKGTALAFSTNTITLKAPYGTAAACDWYLRSPYTGNSKEVGYTQTNGDVQNTYVENTNTGSRPSVNLDPGDVMFTAANEVGGAPLDVYSTSKIVGINLSVGSVQTYNSTSENYTAYGNGSSYRVFKRNVENSNLEIGAGEQQGAITINYPDGSSGQYISVLVINSSGQKWTGRVKHVTDNTKGTVEFFVPQRTPGTSATHSVKVFAWRETEETKTACAPNYQNLTITEADSYKVTYANGGGKNGAASIGFQSVVQGSSCALRPCTFKKTGYYFVGWQGSDGVMYSDQEVVTPTSNLTLTAIWSNSYKTITYKPGNGTGSDITFNSATGSKVKLPEPSFTAPAGASFIEWNTSEDGTGSSYQAGDAVILSANLTLYAVYGTKAAITYDANGGTGEEITQEGYLEKQFELKSDGFTRKGYSLSGWNTAPDGSGTGYELGEKVTLTGDCTLYAQWNAKGYKVAYDANGAAKGEAPSEVSLNYGGSTTVVDADLYLDKKVFAGWNTASDGSGTDYKKDDTITADDDFPSEGLTLYAKWENAANYKVSYNLNKPAGAADSTVDGDLPLDNLTCFGDGLNTTTTAAEPGVKIKGYVFKGWSASALTPPLSTELIKPGDTLTPTASLPLYAIWASATQWKVTYSGTTTGVTGDFPKDEGAYYDDGFTYETAVKDNSGQTKEGHIFKGWSAAENSTTAEYTAGSKLSVTGNMTLYAVWETNDCTVTYDRNASGGSGSVPSNQAGKYGTEFTVSAAPSDMKNPGRTFTGWNSASDGSGKSYTAGQKYSFSGDITLYAQWTDSQYQIVFHGNGSEKGTVPSSLTPAYGDTITIPDAGLAKKGVVFDGWNTADDGSGTSYAAKANVKIDDSFSTGTTTLYAKWKDADTYKLCYNTNAGNETVTGDLPGDTDYDADGISNVLNVTDVIPVRKGYAFMGWSTTADGTVSYTAGQKLTLNKDTTLYAVWSQGSFALIYRFNGGNDTMHGDLPATVTGGPTTTGITAAGQGTLKRERYKFTGWNTESDGSGKAYQENDAITLNENLYLYAQWESVQQAVLSYDKNCLNPETIMPSDDKGHYDDGLSHEATIATDTPMRRGYEFKGWSLDKDADPDSPDLLKGGDKITVTSDTTVYAIWKLGTYTLKYDKNVKSSDPDQPEGSWPADVTGTVTMTLATHDGKGITRANYTLKGWNTQADGKGTSYTLGITYSLVADETLYAVWEPVTYTIHYDAGADDVTGTVPSDHSGKYQTDYQAAQGSGMSKPGGGFSGWNDQRDGGGNSYTPGATYQYLGNKTLYAQWSDKVWTIKFDTSSAEQGDTIADTTGGLNANLKLPDGNGLKRARETFDGWNTAPDGASGTPYAAGGSLTIEASTPNPLVLYAKWKAAADYTLTYDKNGSEVSGTVPSAVTCYNDKINHETVIPENTLTRKGYTFAGWSESKSGSVQYRPGDTINMAEKGKNLTLYAVWGPETFKLMYDANAADITGAAPAAVTGSAASDIKAASQGSMYRAKYQFIGWNTESDGSGTTIQPDEEITLNENKVLYALWKPLSALHVIYNSGCDDLAVDATLPKDTKEYYNDGINGRGSISTLRPIRHGYTFSYWSTQKNGGGTRYNGGEDIKVTSDLTLYAVWDMGNYTLTYNGNANDIQGVMPPNKYGTVLSSIKAEDSTGFSRPYYTFKGWNTESNGSGMTYQPGDDISLGRDIILYAQWRETVYKVKFDLNSPAISEAEGTVPESIQGTHLEKFRAPKQGDLTCRKYKFTGWNTDPDGAGEQFEPGEEYRYEVFEDYGEEVTLYANWISVPPFEVVYYRNAKDATGDEPIDSNLYVPEDGTNLATVLGKGNLFRRGYEFVCWTTKKDGSGSKYVEGSRFYVTAHTALYAQWTPGTYTLTYNKNGTDVSGKAPSSIRSSSQEDIKAAGPNTMKKKNHEFLGWSTKANATVPAYKEGSKFRILEDTTVYAVWRKLINVSIEYTEGLEPTTNNFQSVSQGSKLSDVKLPEVKEGYEIEGWIVNGQKVTNPKDYVLDNDAEVQAIVKKKPVNGSKKEPDKDNTQNSNSGGSSGESGGNGNSGTNGNNSTKDGTKPASATLSAASGTASRSTTFRAGKVTPGNNGVKSVEKNTNKRTSKGTNLETANTAVSVPNAADENIVGKSNQKTNAYGPSSECRRHWYIIVGIILSCLYTVLRSRRIKKKELLKSNMLFDLIIPFGALPLCAVARVYQYCRLDIYMIGIWLVLSILEVYYLSRCCQKNVIELEEVWQPVVEEYEKKYKA